MGKADEEEKDDRLARSIVRMLGGDAPARRGVLRLAPEQELRRTRKGIVAAAMAGVVAIGGVLALLFLRDGRPGEGPRPDPVVRTVPTSAAPPVAFAATAPPPPAPAIRIHRQRTRSARPHPAAAARIVPAVDATANEAPRLRGEALRRALAEDALRTRDLNDGELARLGER